VLTTHTRFVLLLLTTERSAGEELSELLLGPELCALPVDVAALPEGADPLDVDEPPPEPPEEADAAAGPACEPDEPDAAAGPACEPEEPEPPLPLDEEPDEEPEEPDEPEVPCEPPVAAEAAWPAAALTAPVAAPTALPAPRAVPTPIPAGTIAIAVAASRLGWSQRRSDSRRVCTKGWSLGLRRGLVFITRPS
jgi:hypothetical protein